MEIPQVGKTYDCFDDGKISKSRRYKVTVEKVIKFNNIDRATLSKWEGEVKTCDWLYRNNTDFFVICSRKNDDRKEVFVRTIDNGWFSIGNFLRCGRLDIDLSLAKLLN